MAVQSRRHDLLEFAGTGAPVDSFADLGLSPAPQPSRQAPPAPGKAAQPSIFDPPFGPGESADFESFPFPAATGQSQAQGPSSFDPFGGPQGGFGGGNQAFPGAFGAASLAPSAVPILPGSNAVPQRSPQVVLSLPLKLWDVFKNVKPSNSSSSASCAVTSDDHFAELIQCICSYTVALLTCICSRLHSIQILVPGCMGVQPMSMALKERHIAAGWGSLRTSYRVQPPGLCQPICGHPLNGHP